MKIEIKNRFDNSVIFSHECEGNSIKITVVEAVKAGANLYGAEMCGANLRGANLRGADLCDANLCDANLRGADLHGANLHGANLYGAEMCGANLYGDKLTKNPLFLFNLQWGIVVTTSILKIGCQVHPISDWRSFDDDKISSMAPDALDFWRKNKAAILALCDAHCAE